jgi:hypothetical protein
MIRHIDAYALARVVAGLDLNLDTALLSPTVRSMVDHLTALPCKERGDAFRAMAAARDDGPELLKAVDAADPMGPPPEADDDAADETTGGRCATLADLRRLVADTTWPWPGWLASKVLNALAADPGTGKTVCAMDLARRLYRGEPWPDGTPNPFPPGSRTLWVPGDRHYPQLLDLANAYGIPDDAVLFNAPPSDPVGGLELDDPATLAALESRIKTEALALVIVDTVGMTTGMNLCRPEDARAYFSPLMDMAQRTGVPFLLLTHTSKDGDALGRRIVGACRTVWKMTTPDPEGQPNRRRFWVDKSYIVKPLPLGMTIDAAGCSFDFNPPVKPEAPTPGPAPEKRAKAEAFIRDSLAQDNDQRATALCTKWCDAGGKKQTFWDARDAMVEAGEVVCDGKPLVLHLNYLEVVGGSDGDF